MAQERFQNKVATKGIYFLFIFILCTIIYVLNELFKPVPAFASSYFFWQMLVEWIPGYIPEKVLNYLLFGLTGYLLLELNNAFSIIRVRTTIQTTLYFLLIVAFPFVQTLQPGNIISVCFYFSVFLLFWSTQQERTVSSIFGSFLFIGLGSLLFPQLLFLVPVFYIIAALFNVLNGRTFFAALVGIIVPYWFLAGHSFFYDKMELFYTPFIELINIKPIDYSGITIPEIIAFSFSFLFFLLGTIHYFATSYKDKLRTRLFLNVLILLSFSLFIFCVLQPQHLNTLLLLLFPVNSLLAGHFFALTSSRFTNILFILTVLLLFIIIGLNIWMW